MSDPRFCASSAKNLPFTKHYVDHNGHVRFYMRKKGVKAAPLPSLPWSPEFMAACEAALNGAWDVPSASKVVGGTVGAAVICYLASKAFEALGERTRVERRRILERFRKEHGAKRIDMPTEALRIILKDKRPAAQRNWKKALRGLVDYCIEVKLIDPLVSIKLAKMKKTGSIQPDSALGERRGKLIAAELRTKTERQVSTQKFE